jgi:glycosyltransferase involved in cell wall biosynthesis
MNPAHTDRANRKFQLVFVGRFLYLKGMGLGIQAIATAHRAGIPIQLTLIGHGPAQNDWRVLANRLGLAEHVVWIPWMTQEELLRSYGHFDALLFPSLHDSSGNVILEAMANGLPVICLNLGGPPCLVDRSCGRVVEVAGKVEEQVVQGLAESISELATDARLTERLREGARARARQLSWATIVSRTWGIDGVACRAVMDTVGYS